MSDSEMIIKPQSEWKNDAIQALDESMQHLMKCRKLLIEHNLLKKDWETYFQTGGEQLLLLLKEFQKKDEK
jgi:hypothetical protein